MRDFCCALRATKDAATRREAQFRRRTCRPHCFTVHSLLKQNRILCVRLRTLPPWQHRIKSCSVPSPGNRRRPGVVFLFRRAAASCVPAGRTAGPTCFSSRPLGFRPCQGQPVGLPAAMPHGAGRSVCERHAYSAHVRRPPRNRPFRPISQKSTFENRAQRAISMRLGSLYPGKIKDQ